MKKMTNNLRCTLTTPELRHRKATVLKRLQSQILEKQELANGFSFRFPGSDEMVDHLTEFIKTERACCNFFTFDLSVKGDKSESWLRLSGPEGVKDFIRDELGFLK